MFFPVEIHYWYEEKERKARDWDLKYMKEFVGYGFSKLRGNGSRRHGAVLSGADGAGAGPPGAMKLPKGMRLVIQQALDFCDHMCYF